MNPYRDAAPFQDRPGRMLRMIATITPQILGVQWRWYRRAKGGRWSKLITMGLPGKPRILDFPIMFNRSFVRAWWFQVTECPTRNDLTHSLMSLHWPELSCCFDVNSDGTTVHRCLCETWP